MRESLHPTISSCRARRPALLLLTLSLVLPLGAAAQPAGGPRLAAGPGVEATAPDGSPAERVSLGPALFTRLLAIPPEGEARVADWPVAPGLRADVVLARREIYAPDARIFKVEGSRRTELPRSELAFFWGTAEGDDTTRVFVALDPKGRLLESFVQSRAGLHELRPLAEVAAGETTESAPGEYLLASAESLAAARGIDTRSGAPTWTCGEESFSPLDRLLSSASAPAQLGSVSAAVFSSLHGATIAVDTDNELLSLKFSDNTTAATNYIASLIAAMNVMYERDIKVRLLQGTTFLRVSTTPDPYTSGFSSAADPNHLNEFSNYWSAHYGNVQRALAMMLSGKQSTSSSASGIAWINGLCSTSVGYSFSQVFKVNYLTGDTLVVGHEIGHNFGSPHTHCYSPPIDNCYNGESGCYSGTPSCPSPATINGVTNVTGTAMSYCHVSGLSGCTSSLVFHPRTVQLFDTILPGKSCVPALAIGPAVSAIAPNSGSTGGGTAVAITGSNFAAGATVAIGGVAATAVAVVDASHLTAVTGAHATGTVSVTVTNAGGASGSLGNSYFYAPPSPAGDLYTLTPCRAVDTRKTDGPLGGPTFAPSAQRTFKLTGACGVPSTAKAVEANVTAVVPPAAGFFTFFPGNAFPLGTSTLSFKAGTTRANNAVLMLATDGSGTVGVQNASGGAVDLLIDVFGYYQ